MADALSALGLPEPQRAGDALSALGLPEPGGTPMRARSARAADPQRRATVLERVLDTLNAPSNAVAGAAEAMTLGENPIAGLAQGVRDKTNFGDILRHAGVTGPGAAVGGFALDVATDPLNLVGGVGALTKAGEAAKAADLALKAAELSGDAGRIGKAAEAVAKAGKFGASRAEQARSGQRALVEIAGKPLGTKAAEPIFKAADAVTGAISKTAPAKALRKGFVAGSELAGNARDLFLQRVAGIRGQKGTAIRDAGQILQPVAREIYRTAAAHDLDPRELQRAITTAVERSKPGQAESAADAVVRSVDATLSAFPDAARSELTPHVRDAVSRINTINATNLAATKEAGVKLTELAGDLQYIRHTVRDDLPEWARQALKDAGAGDEAAGAARVITERHAPQKSRTFTGTVAEFNALAEAGKLKILGNRPLPGGLFVEDPFLATMKRAGEAGKSVASANVLSDYARVYGKPITEAPADWVTVPSEVAGLEGIAFPPDVGAALRTHFEQVVQPGYFLRQWDALNRLWSRHTVGVVPVTEFRNLLGDAWNAIALGGMDPRRIADASQIVARGTPLEGLLGAGRELSFDTSVGRLSGEQVKDLAQRLGVFDATEMSQLLDDFGTLRQAPKSAGERIGRIASAAVAPQWQAKAAKVRERGTRLALFLDRLTKGDIPEAAALYTKKHLFDYGEMTPVERGVLKRVFPFYSWMRNNAPLQLSYLFRKPTAFSAVQKARNEAAGEGSLGVPEAPLPRFLSEGLPMQVGRNAEGNPQMLRLQGYLPAADLANVIDPTQALQNAVNNVSPFASVPAQIASGVDLFRSDIGSGKMQPLEDYPGERVNFLGLPVPARAMPALTAVRALSELNRLNPGGVFGNRQEGPFGIPRTTPDTDPLTRLMNVAFGRTYAVDPEREIARAERERAREIAGLERQLKYAESRGDRVNAERIISRINVLASGENYATQ